MRRIIFKKACVLLIAVMLFGLKSKAQTAICGFDAVRKQMLEKDPGYREQEMRNEAGIQKQLRKMEALSRKVINGTDTIYEIPIVIHVLHTGGPVGSNYNPSDAKLLEMMDYLNQSYAATWPAYSGVGSGGTRVPIRFVLARRTPDCQATDGIIRVDASGVPNYTSGGIKAERNTSASEEAVKAVSIWPANSYFNLWVVNKIDGEDGYNPTATYIAGYALRPIAPGYRDGMVILASTAKGGNKVLPHEIGHSLGLLHTFEGSGPNGNSCPLNANCEEQGDKICDTDPTRLMFNCPSGINPCTNQPWNGQQTNFMAYTNCTDQTFTPGQRDRMVAVLLELRPGLLTSMGLQAPDTATIKPASCKPTTIVNINNDDRVGPWGVYLDTLEDVYGPYTLSRQFYQDFSCNLGTSLTIGAKDTLRVLVANRLRQFVKAYIDFNDNGSFEANEQVMNSITPATIHRDSLYFHNAALNIPASAVINKKLRLRVSADNADFAGQMDACVNTMQSGAIHDYFVIIKPKTPLAIDDYTAEVSKLKVFPNPTSGDFTIERPDQMAQGKIQIVLTDVYGRKMLEQEYTGKQSIKVSTSGLPSGIYLLSAFSNGKKWSQKVVISH